jgi:hypothetical protein
MNEDNTNTTAPIREDDEGEVGLAIGTDKEHGVVFVQFPKPVTWFAVDSAMARSIAMSLLEKADDLDGNPRQKH